MEREVFSDLFFQPGVLDGALQQTRPRQEDIVAPILSLAECPGGIGDGGFQIAAIEMEQSRIDVHGADAAVLPGTPWTLDTPTRDSPPPGSRPLPAPS